MALDVIECALELDPELKLAVFDPVTEAGAVVAVEGARDMAEVDEPAASMSAIDGRECPEGPAVR